MESLKMYFTRKAILNVLSNLVMILIAVTISNVLFMKVAHANDPVNPFDDAAPNPALIIDYALALISTLTLVWGEIAKVFGLKNKVKEIIFVIAGGGLAIFGVMYNYGVVDSLSTVFAVFSALGLFDLLKASKRTIKAYFPWA